MEITYVERKVRSKSEAMMLKAGRGVGVDEADDFGANRGLVNGVVGRCPCISSVLIGNIAIEYFSLVYGVHV